MEEKHYASSVRRTPHLQCFGSLHYIIRFNDCVIREWQAEKPPPLSTAEAPEALEARTKTAREAFIDRLPDSERAFHKYGASSSRS